MSVDTGLLRRLQLVQGMQWLRAAQGDPFAALLRGHVEDLDALHERLLAREHIWLSDTGTWVAARYRTAAAVLADPAFDIGLADWRPAGIPVMPLTESDLGSAADPVPGDLAATCARVLDSRDGAFDLAPVAAEIAVEAVAEALGLTGSERDLLAAGHPSAGLALDGLLCPQGIEATEQMLGAVTDLRALFAQRPTHLFLAVVGVRIATDLLVAALAAGSVDEALRRDPPVRVQLAVARTDTDVDGQRITAGSQVAVLLEAANRDPSAVDRPVLLPAGPCGQVLPFARALAEAALASGGLTVAGPPVRRPRAPVSRGVRSLPATTTRSVR